MPVANDISYEPHDPGGRQQILEVYQELLERAPVYRTPSSGMWVVSRYDDVAALMQNPGALSSGPQQDELLAFPPKVDQFGHNQIAELIAAMLRSPVDLTELAAAQVIIGADEPEHTRLRRLVSRGITPRRLESLGDTIARIVVECLEGLDDEESFDVVDRLAAPLPVRVVSHLISAEPARHADVARWSEELARVPQGVRRGSPEHALGVARVFSELSSYLVPLIEARRAATADDLISDIICPDGEDVLTATEAVLFLLVLLAVGNQTTTNLIGNAVVSLMRNPEQLQLLNETPGLMPNAVEETLRCESPLQFGLRRTLEDLVVEDVTIPAGAVVVLLWGAANRDPRRFPDPDRFDITRSATNLAFGSGIHHCLGARLAHMETTAALAPLTSRLPSLQLEASTLELLPGSLTRGYRHIGLVRSSIRRNR